MTTPRLSIIVPVYNVEKYLRRCIDSILAQTFTDFELLLIDDGSKDSSDAICDEYAKKDTRVRVFHKPNGGVSTARNLGIDNAHGEYITFVDSDDWVEPNYGQVLIDNVGDADIMFFDEIWHYDDGFIAFVSSGFFFSKDRNEIEKKILQMHVNKVHANVFGHTWNKIIKKSLLDDYNIRFVKELWFFEDEIFALDYCLHINSFKVLSPSRIYNYRMSNTTGLTCIKKPFKQWVILSNSIEERISYCMNETLKDHLQQQVVKNSLNALLNSKGLRNFFVSFGMCLKKIHQYGISRQNIKFITRQIVSGIMQIKK